MSASFTLSLCPLRHSSSKIFRFMEPRDLLSLARTTTLFRKLLMSRSASGMWRAARTNVEDLPECPQYLSEPEYANLVFYSHCHVRS